MSSDSIKRKANDALTVPFDFLECSVCCERFNTNSRTPRLLSACGHHFCETCLDTLKRKSHGRWSIRCPSCQTESNMKNGEVALMQKNWALVGMVDEASRGALAGASAGTTSISASSCAENSSSGEDIVDISAHCELCNQPHAATHHCHECEQSMCQVVADLHRRQKSSMQHRLEPISEEIMSFFAIVICHCLRSNETRGCTFVV